MRHLIRYSLNTRIIALFCFSSMFVGCEDKEVIAPQTQDAADAQSLDATSDSKDSSPSDTLPETPVTTDAQQDSQGDQGSNAETTPDAVADTGPSVTCLSSHSANEYFNVFDESRCVVAEYTVNESGLSSLSWGRHGGPLSFDTGTSSIVRLDIPAGSTGEITAKRDALKGFTPPTGTFFWSQQAVDLPFFDWTVISYTDLTFSGEALFLDGSANLQKSYKVNGFFSASSVSLLSASGGRLVYTGTSPIAQTASTTNEGALYAADSCGTPSQNPRLLPEGTASCKAPIKVATWQKGASGPVSKDFRENIFVIMSEFNGKQELRGFERSAIERGQGATTGEQLFVGGGFTSELAADGQSVFFQPNTLDSNFKTIADDVTMVDYSADTTSKKIVVKSAFKSFLKTKLQATPVVLVADNNGRLWVGIADQAKPASNTGDAGVSDAQTDSMTSDSASESGTSDAGTPAPKRTRFFVFAKK